MAGNGATIRSPELAAWRERGSMVEVFGRRVFVVEVGSKEQTPILILHGFPTCSLDFARTLPVLARGHRVIVHDHLGFGLSEKPDPAEYSYSLLEQAEIAIGLWTKLGVRRGHLVSHDYGTSVATEVLARRERGGLPFELASATFSNGSMLRELAQLRLAQVILKNQTLGPILARLSNPGFFKKQIRAILAKPEQAGDAELEALFEAVAWDHGQDRLVAISQYHDERVRFRERWIGALRRLDIPVHVLWGKRDPIAIPLIAETLARMTPGARLTWLEDIGHYPMLEAPERWAELVVGSLPAG